MMIYQEKMEDEWKWFSVRILDDDLMGRGRKKEEIDDWRVDDIII